ncbi:permease prefix domain 1-containing protein [Clostridium pasteurianum]|uniref:permease prefix domain 1-containing protein n=1 Tax=Clostridium pasteurianum TaxID=1501 RepID=UPI0035310688
MSQFKEYVNRLLKKTRLNRSEKKDLEDELIEHLNNMKDDYIEKGMSEKDSINMAIKNFKSSDFLKEITNFTINRKLVGINISYLLKINIMLIFTYLILMIINFTLFETNQDKNLLYFLIICFVLFVNYYYTFSRFQLKKDIISNISITCFTFFLIEKVGIIILSKIYRILTHNPKFNILDLYVLDFKKILIYIILSITVILLAKYDILNAPKINFKLSTIDILILSSSLIFSILYFLYPNRFYFLNLIISKIFNINVQFSSKNLLYMNINNKFIIINIGLLLILLFIFYKFISRVLKINFKQQ